MNMLIDFPNGTGGVCELDRFLEIATKPPTVKKVRLDGHDCILLSTNFNDIYSGDVRLDAWFDQKENYLVRKRVESWGEVRSESLIQGFQRIGEWSFPTECVGDMFVEGKSDGRAFATFSDIKVNDLLPESIFRLAIPDGTILFDDFDHTHYTVNERWERTGAKVETPLQKSAPPQSDGDAPRFAEQSREEPPSRMHWLLWGSLGFLGLGGCLWAWRNRGRLKPDH